MDGGITRQSEQYGIFEDRPRPERVAREAPLEVIREYTRGPSVGAGQLNPRNIRRHHFADATMSPAPPDGGGSAPPSPAFGTPAAAYESTAGGASGYPTPGDLERTGVNTQGMDPESHAYHEETYRNGPGGEWLGDETGYPAPRRHYNPYSGYEPTDRDERASEGVHEDDESGYNWGPEPKHDDPYGGHAPETPLQPLHQFVDEWKNPPPLPHGPPSFSAARRRQADGGQMMTHMFTPGSRVGLPYGNDVIPGIVHQLYPTSEVGVRWGDGQYTTESPGDIQPL